MSGGLMFTVSNDPHEYHGIDEDFRETAARWATGQSPLIDRPPMRPWNVFSPRALGCTFCAVLSEYIEHTRIAVHNANRFALGHGHHWPTHMDAGKEHCLYDGRHGH